MTLNKSKEGQRVYVAGDTFPIKAELKKLGAHFDPDRKAWWVGTGKEEQIDLLLKRLQSGSGPNPYSKKPDEDRDARGDNTVVCGAAFYKGRYYYVIWHGETKKGTVATKLVFRDGSATFWAKEPVTGLKRYSRSKTIGSIKAWKEKQERAKEEHGGSECAECGSSHVVGTKVDSSGIPGPVCARCIKTPNSELSFA